VAQIEADGQSADGAEVATLKKEKAEAQAKLKSQGEKNQDLANRRREAVELAKVSAENERQAHLYAKAAESKVAEQEERVQEAHSTIVGLTRPTAPHGSAWVQWLPSSGGYTLETTH
jgi:glucose-6-phosphate dehydrogenase assembly protein OpcA